MSGGLTGNRSGSDAISVDRECIPEPLLTELTGELEIKGEYES